MKPIRKVLELSWGLGLSKSAVARAVVDPVKNEPVSRRTVTNYLKRAEAAQLSWPFDKDISNDELESLLFPVLERSNKPPLPDCEYLYKEMKRPCATLMILWEEYREECPNGIGYSRFCDIYRKYKKTFPSSMRQDHKAGENIFVDYSGKIVGITVPETGEIRKAQIFVGVLGASNYSYAEATWDQTLASWIGSHIRMFEYFGGTSRYLVPDNLKSAVTVAGWKKLVLNRTYEDMSDHYGVIVEPARARKPKDKSKAETGVKIVQRWILFRLRNYVFTSLQELNAEIGRLLVDFNNRKTRKIPEGRTALFEELDKPELSPLPPAPYQLAMYRTCRVQPDYTISVDDHHYSVPYSLIGQQVDVKITEKLIEVFHKDKRVAMHPKSHLKGKSTISESHMPDNHRAIKEWTPERLSDVAKLMGNGVETYVAWLSEVGLSDLKRYRLGRRLVGLSEKYGVNRLNNACVRARLIQASNIESIEHILKNNRDQLHLESNERLEDGLSEHKNIRGSDYYH